MIFLIIATCLIPYIMISGVVYRRAALTIAWNRSDRHRQSRPDRYDISSAKMDASMYATFWPVLLVCLGALKVFNFGSASLNSGIDFKTRPEPIQGPVKTIKTKRENKAKAKALEKKTVDAERRMAVNKHEIENNIPLTVWEDS